MRFRVTITSEMEFNPTSFGKTHMTNEELEEAVYNFLFMYVDVHMLEEPQYDVKPLLD